MRAQAFPGEDPESLTPPEAIAEAVLPLVAMELDQSGSIFDFIDGRLQPRAPHRRST
jgi:hypothetical protein